MNNLDWKNILLTGYHAGLVLGAAYAASHQQWAWAVPALTSLAGLSTAPTWALSAVSKSLVGVSDVLKPASGSGIAVTEAEYAELLELRAKAKASNVTVSA